MEYRKERVIGYEDYQVDTNGIVYSKKGKPLKFSINPSGYCIVNFSTNGKTKGFSVHGIVARQYIKNDDKSKNQINHKDGNKLNNNVDNLEWVTPIENTRHAKYILNRITNGKDRINARPIKAMTVNGDVVGKWGSIADAAIQINGKVDGYRRVETNIWCVLSKRRKTYKGLLWAYD